MKIEMVIAILIADLLLELLGIIRLYEFVFKNVTRKNYIYKTALFIIALFLPGKIIISIIYCSLKSFIQWRNDLPSGERELDDEEIKILRKLDKKYPGIRNIHETINL